MQALAAVEEERACFRSEVGRRGARRGGGRLEAEGNTEAEKGSAEVLVEAKKERKSFDHVSLLHSYFFL